MGIILFQFVFLILFSHLFYFTCIDYQFVCSAGTSKVSTCIETKKKALLKFNENLIDHSGRLSSWIDQENYSQWIGVSCDNKIGNVVKLDLRNTFSTNNELGGNNLSGDFPSSLRNCTRMISIDLSNNQLSRLIPTWLGETMRSLLILSVRNNRFSGPILLKICSFSGLHILDLSENNLSGSIPSCFGNLEAFKVELTDAEAGQYQGTLKLDSKGRILYYDTILYLVNNIDLSSNNLSGEIPVQITSLYKLGALNLSRNHLIGNIPTDIGNLPWIETLDILINQLSSPIPPSITTLEFLTHLNLSYNDLSGRIPTSTQFQTKDDPIIFQGNDAPCGPPLKKCFDERTTTSHSSANDEEETDDEDKPEKIWFFLLLVWDIWLASRYFLALWSSRKYGE
ncbi:receptor-like protein 11 [Lycium ferocissimum]|uniref:receptor-like protein 11 n=1 Tax=Lycium ferocissimum TaxID=112874 RepID=UPI002814CAF7|nr:receptor-like protein 11 [Lycium ferocissimum]